MQYQDLVTGDLDGDGRLDAVLVNYFSGRLDAYHLDATTNLFLMTNSVTFPVSLVDAGLAVADFNGDGRPDVVVRNTDTLFVSLGDGTGRLGATATISSSSAVSGPWVGDVNGDGKLDI